VASNFVTDILPVDHGLVVCSGVLFKPCFQVPDGSVKPGSNGRRRRRIFRRLDKRIDPDLLNDAFYFSIIVVRSDRSAPDLRGNLAKHLRKSGRFPIEVVLVNKTGRAMRIQKEVEGYRREKLHRQI
jgi:hypothetical protein